MSRPVGDTLTITPNVALDVTYHVEELHEGASHLVHEMSRRAGGKGVNVASVMAIMGCHVMTTGLLGGESGEQVRTDLDSRGVRHDFVDIPGETRRTVTIVSRVTGDATVLNESGPRVSTRGWNGLLERTQELVRRGDVAVVAASGSLPPGAPADAYAQLAATAHAAGCRAIVDTSGEALIHALAAAPEVVKPNHHELVEVTGSGDPVAGIGALHAKGARVVLLSLGSDGMVLAPPDRPWLRAHLPRPLRGNPTGAGDAAVAAVAAILAAGGGTDSALRDAVAWSAAAVLAPVAGIIDPADVNRLVGRVQVETYPRGG